MTVVQEEAAPLSCPSPLPLLPLSSAAARTPALGNTFGITKEIQPWRNPTGTAFRPRHHQSQEPVCAG